MWLAQTDAVSIAAVAIALISLGWTVWQGAAIRNIETREHAWQAEDRVSAHIEVTRISETIPATKYATGGAETTYRSSDRIRLRNTGRAPAKNVVWSVDADVSMSNQRSALDVLYPGEHYEIIIAMSVADPPDTHFTVKWMDGNGEQETKRLINL